MSLTLPITQHTLPREQAPESAARGLQQSPRPLIDSIPSSPSLYSDDDTDETPRNKPEYPSRNMMAPQRQSTAEQAPALPERSARRASRMLDGIIIPQKMATEDQPPPLTAQSIPHDVYLSSEEDASSSADDFSDFEFESSSDDSQQSSVRRGSQEDTARVVSVVFSGKPCIVNLPRRSISPSSSETSSRPPSRLRRTSTLPIIDRRVSISSSPSSSSVRSSILHPPRTSSMLPSHRGEKQKPLFLSIDPFAAKADREDEHQNLGDVKTPKTPTGMFKRTLSLVRKRSRPSLNTYHNSLSQNNLPSFAMPSHHMEQVREEASAPESKPAPAPGPSAAEDPSPTTRLSSRRSEGLKPHLCHPSPLYPSPLHR
ncbi:hypothetical protein B0J13DRAFT_259407 [Dactylonectria estremocensis]|uniref:Uncharacterized protein n=1 Tax=Dactylonectria estremocensis TaxID=1079267 RepID=A0A9P9F4X4_9HYPO|nr:hypothetical protein B0J13DRAFT_259407 [Dactylonectria estremocensis]